MKRIALFFIIILFMHFPITANAQSINHSSLDTPYRPIEINTSVDRVIGDQITITREFIFSGIISPPSTLAHAEIYNGAIYSGTITLYRFYTDNGNTIAIYKGTLIAET